MRHFLHRLSAAFFYLLGSSMFIAYLFHRNDVLEPWATWWLQVADLPTLFSAISYGALSLERSITDDNSISILTWIVIGLPLSLVFSFFVILNFWNALGLPTQEGAMLDMKFWLLLLSIEIGVLIVCALPTYLVKWRIRG